MIKLTVLYGMPTDPAEFDRHYAEVHIPLARQISGVRRLEASKVTGTPDGAAAPYYLIAELLFDDRAGFEASMGSPEGRATAADVPNFATGGVTMLVSEALE